jgi:alkylated DNA repair protein (DNA oxidative demethylase)
MDKMTLNLFEETELFQTGREELCSGAMILRGFAFPYATAIFEKLHRITSAAPFRHMVTPGGFCMSVALTNCGAYGWVTDHIGYRYDAIDPQSGKPWPNMPDVFLKLAQHAAISAGFENFTPDACLINRYQSGARLSLHQDKNEQDFAAPIVSVSLGIPAIFLWGGLRREDRPVRVPLMHGDVMVWGGAARFHYHGVLPIKKEYHPLTGWHRINLTFRKVI